MLFLRIGAIVGLSVVWSVTAFAEATQVVPEPLAATAPQTVAAAPVDEPATGSPVAEPAPTAPSETAVPAAEDQSTSGNAAQPAATNSEKAATAPVAEPPAEPTLTVSIDLASQTMSVSENGEHRYDWKISSGTSEFPTPRGTFRPQWTAKMWYSRKYDNAPMPHAVFIHGGVAIHATYHTANLGRPASHGCIRLSPGNAKVFYNLVHRHGMKRTRVAVHGTPKWRTQNVASRKVKRAKVVHNYESNFWGWGNSGYNQAPTYQPRVVQPKYFAQKKRPNTYGAYSAGYGGQQPPRYIYRNGQKYVYVQRRPANGYYNGY